MIGQPWENFFVTPSRVLWTMGAAAGLCLVLAEVGRKGARR